MICQEVVSNPASLSAISAQSPGEHLATINNLVASEQTVSVGGIATSCAAWAQCSMLHPALRGARVQEKMQVPGAGSPP